MPTLIRTFFSPWHRYRYSYGKLFEIKNNLEVFIFNLMSRFIGALLRVFFILFGIIVEILIFFIGLIIFFGWLILPFFLFFSLIIGISFVV